jgi:hypothetical protein
MPYFAIKVGHSLTLETTITIHASDRNQARQLAEHMKARGTFGVIAWEVKDAYLREVWTIASQQIEIETVQEK